MGIPSGGISLLLCVAAGSLVGRTTIASPIPTLTRSRFFRRTETGISGCVAATRPFSGLTRLLATPLLSLAVAGPLFPLGGIRFVLADPAVGGLLVTPWVTFFRVRLVAVRAKTFGRRRRLLPRTANPIVSWLTRRLGPRITRSFGGSRFGFSSGRRTAQRTTLPLTFRVRSFRTFLAAAPLTTCGSLGLARCLVPILVALRFGRMLRLSFVSPATTRCLLCRKIIRRFTLLFASLGALFSYLLLQLLEGIPVIVNFFFTPTLPLTS